MVCMRHQKLIESDFWPNFVTFVTGAGGPGTQDKKDPFKIRKESREMESARALEVMHKADLRPGNASSTTGTGTK